MIPLKEKPCKGLGIAKGYGCGKITLYRVYGLCKMFGCYSNWLLNSENGKIKLNKSLLKASKPRIELEQANKDYNEKKGISASLVNTKTVVHSYVRERDKFKPCISCGCNWNDEFEAGHHYSANSYLTLKFNLDNINGQCFFCNNKKEGNFDNYALNLPNRIGLERYNELVKLAGIDKQFSKIWNLDKLKEIRENIKILKKIL
jgi:hypothetical protein